MHLVCLFVFYEKKKLQPTQFPKEVNKTKANTADTYQREKIIRSSWIKQIKIIQAGVNYDLTFFFR